MFAACKVQEERDSIRLRVPGGNGGSSTALVPNTSRQEFGDTSTNVLSANSLIHSSQLSLIRLLVQPVEGSTFLCVVAEYSRC